MTLNEYQQHALETAIYPDDRRIIYPRSDLRAKRAKWPTRSKK